MKNSHIHILGLLILLCCGILASGWKERPVTDVKYIQRSTATSGTLTVDDIGEDVIVIHEAALVATLTIALPATPYNGQKVSVCSVGGITLLTMSGGTLANNLTSMAIGGSVTYMYYAPQTKWYKVP